MSESQGLSTHMAKALAFARATGGTVYRHDGGIWGARAIGPDTSPHEVFSSTVIAGLVRARAMAYTRFERGHCVHFPIEASIVPEAAGGARA